ncbi:hypothetical protein [Chroococcidiopsis sp. TS-821]|nr:hypothetical protein [Chroococcidiopsis sp. TS-821]
MVAAFQVQVFNNTRINSELIQKAIAFSRSFFPALQLTVDEILAVG